MDIVATRVELDAQLVLDAATRSRVIFSDERLPDRPRPSAEAGWTAYGA